LIQKQKFDEIQKANQDLKKELKQLKKNSNQNQIEKVEKVEKVLEIKKDLDEMESKLSLSFEE
jgi:hypothetical protein